MSRMLDAAAAAEFLRQRDDLLLLTHRRPDGDTVGSAGALCLGLRALGKTAYLAKNEDMTPKLVGFVAGLEAPADFVPGTVVAVDIADESLFCTSMAQYKGKVDLCIDHHPSNKGYAADLYLEPAAAATGELICTLLRALQVDISVDMWERIYLAVATDTGCFKFGNTTPYAHAIAADCIAAGVKFHPINRAFFQLKSRARMEVEKALFAGLRFSADGRMAATAITRDFIEGVGANNDDMDNLSTLTMELEGVVCGIVLTENVARGSFKASVRTQAPFDASRICANFGGGGHARAAGATLEGTADSVVQAMMQAAEKELNAHV